MFRQREVGFVSRSEWDDVSPAYTIVSSAAKALREGADLALPTGYELEVLVRIGWMLGTYGTDVGVDARQAKELAEIARGLQVLEGGRFLNWREKASVADFLRTVERATWT